MEAVCALSTQGDLKQAVGAKFLGVWESIPKITPIVVLSLRSLLRDWESIPKMTPSWYLAS